MNSLPDCLPFPNIDPVLLHLGPLQLHWYGLGYVAGIVFAWWYGKKLLQNKVLWHNSRPPLPPALLDDFVLWAALGIVIGGRLGEVLFYHPELYFADPLRIFAIWQGGMSFHGGFIGTVIAVIAFACKHKIPLLSLLDTVAAGVPAGLGLVRICNFINDELWGRPAHNLPWAVCFPTGGMDTAGNLIPRHPSQIYEAGLEGLLLFTVLALLIFKGKALRKPGLTAGSFALGYGLCRFFAEFFREPELSVSLRGFDLTMGMALSLPMILIGLAMIAYALFHETPTPHGKTAENITTGENPQRESAP